MIQYIKTVLYVIIDYYLLASGNEHMQNRINISRNLRKKPMEILYAANFMLKHKVKRALDMSRED